MKNQRKTWFKCLKAGLKLVNPKPKFIFLGDEPEQGAVMLCNHVGTTAPLRLELYFQHNFRFWGAHEMNEGMRSMYKYLSTTFYQDKKHWKPVPAKIMAFFATPITTAIYKGMKLISTYRDSRLRGTIKQSVQVLDTNQSIIIFPEDSTNGYLDVLEGFHSGFVLLLNECFRNGKDLPIYVMYYQKAKNRYIIDKKVMYSTLLKKYNTKEEIAECLKNRCNQLGKYEDENSVTPQEIEEAVKVIE